MPKELKIIFILFLLLILATLRLVFKTNQSDVVSPIVGIDTPTIVDQLGQVSRLGGVVVKEYVFKNTTQETMKLGRITTSCMCTKAKVVLGDKESKWFGMESPGDRNPSLNYELKPGKGGKLVVDFDPNAHGPKGVGPFERSIQLFFNQPRGVKEFRFSGEII